MAASVRETFATRLGTVATMIGVAVGLGNVWRFPYMVGRFGGAAFVLLYLAFALLIGVPALMAEWRLGRTTRRGPVGALERSGLPGGKVMGWLLFAGVTAATGYYCNAVGWVFFHGFTTVGRTVGGGWEAGAVLPPAEGFRLSSLLLQTACTAAVMGAAALVLLRGVRRGIEKTSRILTPFLFGTLLILILRSLTLPGAWEGVQWYILKFRPGDITASVTMAALGQAVFSLALGGTFMVVYGSYLGQEETLEKDALWTVTGDTAAGLLAGLAIFPAVFALGLEPAQGPGLVFTTLPGVFEALPLGSLFAVLFFLSLGGVAFLSAMAALEVLVAALTDGTSLARAPAILLMTGVAFVLALPPMANMEVFLRWDLAFGSGLQTVGLLAAVVAVGWFLQRERRGPLAFWIRWVIPAAILLVGVWWLLTDALGIAAGI